MEVDTPYWQATERLVDAVQELSLARNLERVVAIVREAACALCGADWATFMLREPGVEGDVCCYVDAIGPCGRASASRRRRASGAGRWPTAARSWWKT